jgi:hypothetical protein
MKPRLLMVPLLGLTLTTFGQVGSTHASSLTKSGPYATVTSTMSNPLAGVAPTYLLRTNLPAPASVPASSPVSDSLVKPVAPPQPAPSTSRSASTSSQPAQAGPRQNFLNGFGLSVPVGRWSYAAGHNCSNPGAPPPGVYLDACLPGYWFVSHNWSSGGRFFSASVGAEVDYWDGAGVEHIWHVGSRTIVNGGFPVAQGPATFQTCAAATGPPFLLVGAS